MVTTAPPTVSRLTNRDGRYELKDSVFTGEIYDVTVRQVGYSSETSRVSVEDGTASIADFSIVTDVNVKV